MGEMLRPVRFDEGSLNVALLHKALAALGIPVVRKEVERHRAGTDTREKVRALQERLSIPIDDATLVDERTTGAIVEELKRTGQLSAARRFIVTGTVRSQSGGVKRRQQLIAFDLDLGGVAAHKNVNRATDLLENPGFEFLGHAVSGGDGVYRITFYDWQYRRAERRKADIVVYAIEDEKDGARVVGRSRLVDSTDYTRCGLLQDLDVFITERDELTEYGILMNALNALLRESGTTLEDVAGSGEQLAFAASELEMELSHVGIAAGAELLRAQTNERGDDTPSHELLYALGRQNLPLSWSALAIRSDDELRVGIARATDERVIRVHTEEEVTRFLRETRASGSVVVLNDKHANGHRPLKTLLASALPSQTQQAAFLRAISTFDGDDYRAFWNEHLIKQPEFNDEPRLVSNLLLTQQLSLLTGSHAALVAELQTGAGIKSLEQLMDFEEKDWVKILAKTEVPSFVSGPDEAERARRYAGHIRSLLDAAFPTRRIAKLIEEAELPIDRGPIARGIVNFLGATKEFDFATSRVDDFEEQIEATAGDEAHQVKTELQTLQRTFQISPTPKAMTVLMEQSLNSAYTVANIPAKTFVKTYAEALGGEQTAIMVHQRASHIAARSELTAMHMLEYSHGATPLMVIDPSDLLAVIEALQNHVPNYSELFGTPDLCECEQCRSVYSAAAYLVDLLRFLWRGEPNGEGESPLDILEQRRPDLLQLPLTCENANTIIPYVDLVNEVLEYYTANDSLSGFKGYDTGEVTAEELRANPQNFNLEAYRVLKDAKFPFALPYHQPLDVVRTYSGHLKVSRYDAMRAMNPQPNALTAAAIAAESLLLSQEEYQMLAGEAFDGTADSTALHEYFGYSGAGDLENMSAVLEFLERSGVAYTDLVELIKTRFVNPHRPALEFLQQVLVAASSNAVSIYTKLKQIAEAAGSSAGDATIGAALTAYNTEHGTNITPAQFDQWLTDHFADFRRVATLYHQDSACDLETTKLRTIESIYEDSAESGLSATDWSRIHRFIRLWRKLGWTIHETDLVLAAMGETDIQASTIANLESAAALRAVAKLPADQLVVLWGSIGTKGNKSLYHKLFLNRAVQQIDPAFKADAWGNYLTDPTEILAEHQSTILAAFRIREEDLHAIFNVARIIDGGNPRALDPTTDRLNLANLSTIYRHVALAKSLKLRVSDVCTLIELFDVSPFSTWDIDQQRYTNIDPQQTWAFHRLAAAVKEAGFKPVLLKYILLGTVSPEFNVGLTPDEIHQALRAIREAFAAIEQSHPDVPPLPLTSEQLMAKLALTFQPEVVGRFIGIVDGTAIFETITDTNLNIVIPDDLSAKYVYVKASGRLSSIGVMSDADQATLKGLPNANANFQNAVDALYAAPEEFLTMHFDGIFADSVGATATLLNHPAQATPPTNEQKLIYVYHQFVPVLKEKLRRDAVTQHIAGLIGMGDTGTAVLIASDIAAVIADLSLQGFSGTYFSDASWSTPTVTRMDASVNFAWGTTAPETTLPADNFSVRWDAYIAARASGEHTLVVDVTGPDEVFTLYLDDVVILQKTAADPNTSLEVTATLNARQLHRLRLEYAEAMQEGGVRLRWKTATTALEAIPASVAYPAGVIDAFAGLITLYHRAAKLILGFGLSDTELSHLIEFSADFGNLDFKALTTQDWRRVNDYVALRDDVPQGLALLTDVFAAAASPGPVPDMTELKSLLHHATAWDETDLDYLVDTRFALTVADFRNEIALNWLRDVMRIVARTGLSAETIAAWGSAETDFDVLNNVAQLMKNTVKAQFDESDWLQIAGELSNNIRENQKQALIGYLLTRPAIKSWGATDADGLFEYFLIDVQMSPCMDTSRVVQANASVQMFVNRCLLRLESESSDGSEVGVSPAAIDKDRWEWMKNYRVWEANRKVFLYPENWLEPEWRTNRSEFFRELESYLVQNDITERSVEQAFRNYLTSLSEVSNLEVCGMCRENYADGNLKYLHVFARTHNAPYKFFHRTWDEYRKWSAWSRVTVDVRSVEAGESSGVHLIPVVWKNRLFLFWPEFIEKQEQPPANATQSAQQLADDQVSTLAPIKHWEIRLAWSEHVDGKWTPKLVSKEFIKQEHSWYLPGESKMRFATEIEGAKLIIYLATETTDPREWYLEGRFELSDPASKVAADSGGWGWAYEQWDQSYSTNFMNVAGYSNLQLLNNTYLKGETEHRLLLTPESANFDPAFKDPFFFAALQRTYFVRPVTITVINGLKNPDWYVPFFPGIVDDSRYRWPFNVPVGPDDYIRGNGGLPTGPDDYMPVEVITRTGRGRTPAARMSSFEPMQPMMATATRAPASSAAQPRMEMRGFAMSATSGFATGARVMSIGDSIEHSAEIGDAFAMETEDVLGNLGLWMYAYDRGFEFHTFYHPVADRYVDSLNRDGLTGLMSSDTAIPSDDGATFVDLFDPNFTNGYVQKPADFEKGTYFKENVCFDVYGATSIYNWELFFHAPLYIATRLSKNGKYEEAMRWFHYIFDPQSDTLPAPGESATSRYWKVLPFKTTPAESLEDWFRNLAANNDPNTENAIIGEWRDHPFDPHRVAANRPLAYMKNVVIKYVENLLAWGDSLFRQDTMESVNEAIQLYVIANHILGPRPQFVPKRGEIKAETYNSLSTRWDDFSNALVELENIFPYSSSTPVSGISTGTSLLGVGSALYFCIPPNAKLLTHWDTVADRLSKIRHCQNIEGVERKLALFAPPIDPGALIQATSQGLSLGSILADLSAPPPIYRFTQLVQKANEVCADVKTLGSALLATLEKRDAEQLSRLRASHETQMLQLLTGIRERTVLDAKSYKDSLVKAREAASFRMEHYLTLLGRDAPSLPAPPTVDAALSADSQLPPDTAIPTIATDVDDSLEDSGERGVKLIPREAAELALLEEAGGKLFASSAADVVSGFLGLIPQFTADGKPLGVGAGAGFGGRELSWFAGSMAKMLSTESQMNSMDATKAAKMAGYIRRDQEWTLQANIAAREIIQLDKQITSADIRLQVAQQELENHKQQIENAEAVELFLKNKFTNQELYQWMKEQLFSVYKQSYNIAYEMAKKAEKAYKYELGDELASFIQYGYWDDSKQGLAAGDKLQLALRQMEMSYLDANRRELELSKHISLARVDPLALIELRETGRCYLNVPEELFDLDFQGHYFRRIKSVRLSIPSVAGPYDSISCTLRLLNNAYRANTSMNSSSEYEHENDEGLPIDDERFRTSLVPVSAMATSIAQNDAGLFQFDFRDERYLPFERAGAISGWRIELSMDKDLRLFDYSTISDVILHMNYTAREAGGLFKEKATTYIKGFLANAADLQDQPLTRLVSLKHEFPTEWYQFLHPRPQGAEQILRFTMGKGRFPFFAQQRKITVLQLDVLARFTNNDTYNLVISHTNDSATTVTSSEIVMPQSATYGGMNKTALETTDAGLDLEVLDLDSEMTLKLKRSGAPGYSALTSDPEEVRDLFLVMHYKLA